MKLPDNVALCFANGIKKLPFEVQSALKTLSMFGTTTKISYLTELEKKLSLNVTAFLKTAAADGLVSYMKGVVQFNHDRIQEVVYSMIDEQVRLHFHLIYGDCLVKLSEEVGGDVDMMFMGVHQINLGGPSAVADPGDLVTMVRYNLTAGKRAMEMSGFALAFSFFGCGIQFLPSNYWSEHYHLSLELFELASKAALVSGNDRRFGLMSDEVLNHATCFEDKLNINYIIMGSLVSTPKIAEALEMGRAILSRLGEVIPGDSSSENLDEHIKSTQALIKGMNEDDLLNYRMMTDDIQLMKMKFLAKTESIAILIRPDLHPFITLKMVQLTISHGKLRQMVPLVLFLSSC
jgi:predicted ATPase